MLDLTKSVQLRNGQKARYIGAFKAEPLPSLLFAVESTVNVGTEFVVIRFVDGRYSKSDGVESSNDVINAPPEPVRTYRNHYPDGGFSGAYSSLALAICGRDKAWAEFVLETSVLDGVKDYKVVYVYGKDK